MRFKGRVQGVGFRWFVKETAEALDLTGWVRNEKDGSVEAEIEGSEESLNEFLKIAKTGNLYARVDEIVTKPQPSKEETTFKII